MSKCADRGRGMCQWRARLGDDQPTLLPGKAVVGPGERANESGRPGVGGQ